VAGLWSLISKPVGYDRVVRAERASSVNRSNKTLMRDSELLRQIKMAIAAVVH
jgi:hypothetical protein